MLSKNLDEGTVLCFTNLDKFVDEDMRVQPSRGEFRASAPAGKAAGERCQASKWGHQCDDPAGHDGLHTTGKFAWGSRP